MTTHDRIPRYRRPDTSFPEPKLDFALWDSACCAYEEKRYRRSLVDCLKSQCPEVLSAPSLESGVLDFEAPHGSTRVRLSIDDDVFRVRAPFVRIGNANVVALLRRVAETNFRPLTLAQIVKEDDLLCFEYETPVELCHPSKIQGVLREICFFADALDDEFIERYGASFIQEPPIKELTPKELSALTELLQEIGDEYRRYLKFFEEKLQEGYQWAITRDLAAPDREHPDRARDTEIEAAEQLETAYNVDLTQRGRIDGPRKFLDDFFAGLEAESLGRNFYHATKLVSPRNPGVLPLLQQHFEAQRQQVNELIQSGDNYGGALVLQHFFIKILHDFNLDEPHEDAIEDALERTGGTETSEAARDLKQVFQHFADGKPELIVRRSKGGFLSRLFG